MIADQHDPPPRAIESCPHCGHPLSPWEKVLLNVDRALMCRHCWYRIIVDVRPGGGKDHPTGKDHRDGQPS